MSDIKKPGWKTLPIASVMEPGSSKRYKTGDWRAFKPIIDRNKCIKCLMCWMFCPEPAIVRTENGVEVNYDFCKGCGICATECPAKAIKMVEEGT